MRFKVELRKKAVRFIKHECNAGDRAAFYDELEKLRTDPISNSGPVYDPAIKPYMLRQFRFGQCLAIFEVQPAAEKIIVRVCKKKPPSNIIARNADP